MPAFLSEDSQKSCASAGVPGVPGAVLHPDRLQRIPVGLQLRARRAAAPRLRPVAGGAPRAVQVN